MSWSILILSGALEAVWATALGRSEGLSRLGPALVFLIALVLSMSGLAFALRTLPTGTAYAVWVGVGAVLTVIVAVVSGEESLTVTKAVFLTAIVGSVVGLQVAERG